MAKLLVVDDEEFNRDVFKEILEDAGYEVMVARDGREAISFLVANPDLDLILSDVDMPRVNGFELTRWIRQNRQGIPVVLMSGAHDRLPGDLIVTKLRLLQKPISREFLLRVVAEALPK